MLRCHFRRTFKQACGLSPLAYHRQLRLLEAQRGLLAGERVQDLALELAFSDAAHLSRELRRAFKVIPARYRSAFASGR